MTEHERLVYMVAQHAMGAFSRPADVAVRGDDAGQSRCVEITLTLGDQSASANTGVGAPPNVRIIRRDVCALYRRLVVRELDEQLARYEAMFAWQRAAP